MALCHFYVFVLCLSVETVLGSACFVMSDAMILALTGCIGCAGFEAFDVKGPTEFFLPCSIYQLGKLVLHSSSCQSQVSCNEGEQTVYVAI